MISYVKGILDEKGPDWAVVDANGLGLLIHMPLISADRLPACGREVKIFTYFYVKEDMMALYGFLSKDDLGLFELLLKVNGIGPKGALAVLSGMDGNELRFAILSGDAKLISKKASGVGLKTAQKMILELKDKLDLKETLETALDAGEEVPADTSSAKSEAVLALAALGYSNAQAMKAVTSVEGADSMSVEEILKAALKHI